MSLFNRRPKNHGNPAQQTVDTEAAKKAAAAVNRGDVDEANRICAATADPQATAFQAFRWINAE